MTLKQTLMSWLQAHPEIFFSEDWDGGLTLIEKLSLKRRALNYSDVAQWRLTTDETGAGDYINLVLESGVELVLCHAGFGFSPSFTSLGATVPLPPVVCFQDFYRFRQHVGHLYQDAAQKNEAIRTMMCCLAIIEGAQRVGLDTSAEERDLEVIVEWLESH